MVTPRILQRRRLVPAATGHRRRRASARPVLEQAGGVAARRLGLTRGLTRLYVAGAVLLLFATGYLVLAAQATQSSYDLARLKQQHQQLQAQRDQLRFQDATLHAPARVEQEAQASGMQRHADQKAILGQPLRFDLQRPDGPDRPDSAPRWQRLLAGVFGRELG